MILIVNTSIFFKSKFSYIMTLGWREGIIKYKYTSQSSYIKTLKQVCCFELIFFNWFYIGIGHKDPETLFLRSLRISQQNFRRSTFFFLMDERYICTIVPSLQFRVAHWDTWDVRFVLQFAMGIYYWAYWWQVCMCLHLVCKREIFLSTLMPCAICVHFSQLCRP